MGMEEMSEAESKTGKELFLELVRLLPSSQAEDYYRNRMWYDEDMLLDLRLLQAHRQEAGADDPPTIEELKADGLMPDLPDEKPGGGAWIPLSQRPVGATMPTRPAGSVGSLPGVIRSTPAPAGIGLRPAAPKTAPPKAAAAPAASAAGVGGPSAELRQIALFIAKWKLEATKTKLLLARLTPPRRRWVMTNFKQSGPSPVTTQLEHFISQAERDNYWAAAESTASSALGAQKPTSGLKRPLSTASSVAVDPSKRAKITPGVAKPAGAKPLGYRPTLSPVSAYTRTQPMTSLATSRIGAAKAPAAKATIRSTYGSYGSITPTSGLKPGMPKAGGSIARPGYAAAKPGGLIKPQVGGGYKPVGVGKPGPPKAGPGKAKAAAKPGSLIANLLKM